VVFCSGLAVEEEEFCLECNKAEDTDEHGGHGRLCTIRFDKVRCAELVN